jgi:hypothetical protein
LVVDGDTDFVEVDSAHLAEEAEDIFTVQWDYIHGYASTDDLKRLPADFLGRRVVRDPRELEELARVGAFDIEELYRQLYGEE